MADVNRGDRPLSPHLTVFNQGWTGGASIFTRITGNALIGAALLVVWWFAALAAGPDAYRFANGVLTSWLGDLVFFLSLGALWYHSLAGLRHLIWDTGHMLDLETAVRAGQGIVILSVVLTILTVIIL